ncbi:hypothetical protein [Patulibacter americanus]|uniref:hypothetical protein n=1 Tax=Patulibacter americanus TaxID=588672 RepID=UPI0003B3E0FF|nr:hypothetical protein [Patulibacter americanus]
MSAARRKPSGVRRAPGTGAGSGSPAGTDQGSPASDGGPSPVRRLTDADARRSPARRLTDADVAAPRSRPFAENLAIVAGAFVVSTLIAELAGAANLGTALSFGQIGFAIALVWVLVRR